MAKYEVSWVEYHSVILEAENEEEAYEDAFNNDNGNTCKNIGQEETRKVNVDKLGYVVSS